MQSQLPSGHVRPLFDHNTPCHTKPSFPSFRQLLSHPMLNAMLDLLMALLHCTCNTLSRPPCLTQPSSRVFDGIYMSRLLPCAIADSCVHAQLASHTLQLGLSPALQQMSSRMAISTRQQTSRLHPIHCLSLLCRVSSFQSTAPACCCPHSARHLAQEKILISSGHPTPLARLLCNLLQPMAII